MVNNGGIRSKPLTNRELWDIIMLAMNPSVALVAGSEAVLRRTVSAYLGSFWAQMFI
jgi:hypothetical protein